MNATIHHSIGAAADAAPAAAAAAATPVLGFSAGDVGNAETEFGPVLSASTPDLTTPGRSQAKAKTQAKAAKAKSQAKAAKATAKRQAKTKSKAKAETHAGLSDWIIVAHFPDCMDSMLPCLSASTPEPARSISKCMCFCCCARRCMHLSD